LTGEKIESVHTAKTSISVLVVVRPPRIYGVVFVWRKNRLRLENEIKLDFKDVLIRPKRSTLGSRKEVELMRNFKFKNSLGLYHGIPIMAANMDGVGTFEMARALKELGLFTCLVKTYTPEEIIDFFKSDQRLCQSVAVSIGITDADLVKWHEVYSQEHSVKYVCIDVANGYSENFVGFVKEFRDRYPEIVIIAGNVVTGEMTEELILTGADIVKVGIGPGSVCTTRIQTGVGYPQLSAIIECADAAHGLGGLVIADGGCTCAGDVAKAFGAGADYVMLGGMFAGHDEGGSEIIDGKVQFYGMSSKAANDKHFGGLKEYRASEGRDVQIPHKGKISDTVQEILGGIRSSCTYVGAKDLKNLSKCTTFIRCTQTHNSVFC